MMRKEDDYYIDFIAMVHADTNRVMEVIDSCDRYEQFKSCDMWLRDVTWKWLRKLDIISNNLSASQMRRIHEKCYDRVVKMRESMIEYCYKRMKQKIKL